jgi:S-DNA-T family DNA segregation ATPase FtsK/SpoIIIE
MTEEEKESKIKIIGAEEQKTELQSKAAMDKFGEPAVQKTRSVQTKDTDEIGIKAESFLMKDWSPPPIQLLERDRGKPEVGDIKANANIIKRTLQNFGIIVEMDEISIGPSITRYALKPAEGVKLSKILGLQNNLELALAAHPVRIEAPIPGKSLVGIEIPNMTKTTVGLASLLSKDEYQNSDKPLVISLGKGISGTSHFANLAKMPHLLIAGATGSGKSVSIHTIINSLLFRNSPENLKFIMIDPKRVELTLYNKIPHLLTPVITDAKKAIMSLKWAAKEMDRRYDILEKSRVRDIESYHKNIFSPAVTKVRGSKDPQATALPDSMPYIVIIIDELADIMQTYPRELEAAVVRLAQMSRAVGIHLILSTQRPSVNVITGLIKANIPARIAMQVASQFDSRTIIDMAGAEKLLGAGDMLYLSGEMSKPIRLQSAYISESEVKRVTEFLYKNYEESLPGEITLEASESKNAIFESISDGREDEDELYDEARETVMRAGKASTSFLQRKLRIGYARAARLMDILEEKGVISAGEGAKPREVLMRPEGGFSPQDFGNDDETLNETN